MSDATAWGVLTALGVTAAALAALAWIQAGQIRRLREERDATRRGWAKERDAHGQTLLQLAEEKNHHTNTRTLLTRAQAHRRRWEQFLNPAPDLPAETVASLMDEVERYANEGGDRG